MANISIGPTAISQSELFDLTKQIYMNFSQHIWLPFKSLLLMKQPATAATSMSTGTPSPSPSPSSSASSDFLRFGLTEVQV
jgi:hypothetical protein